MTRAIHPALALMLATTLSLATGGCATLATNVEGRFSCSAPEGTCAPTHAIDAAASAVLEDDSALREARIRAGVSGVVSGNDTARTGERTLRIVFPAHVDQWGTLHDEAVAWVVVETPRWAAELRRKPGDEPAPPLMRQLREQLEAQEADAPAEAPPATIAPIPFDLADPFSLLPPTASPLVLPSTAREAVAGARAPGVEGFDMSPPLHDRTPRPAEAGSALNYPSAEAIDAVRASASDDAVPPPSAEEGE